MTQLGVIFHWGLYSVPGFDDPDSASRRRLQNGSEWYLKRLEEDGKYRPISGYKETQKFHAEHYPNQTYSDFSKEFTANQYNPKEWIEKCKGWGASYVILTAKHHDGWCLWETKTTSYSVMNSPAQKDVLGLFMKEAKAQGLKAGIYYSLTEFRKGCTREYVDTILVPQLREILAYHPDILWLDGHWDVKTKYACEKVLEIIYEAQEKGIEINDRISLPLKEAFKDQNYLGSSSFRVYEDRHIPIIIPKVEWEHINTLGMSWGYNRFDRYKTAQELHDLYFTVKVMKGRFLINIGPKGDGSLPIEQVKLMDELNEKNIRLSILLQ